MLQTKNAKKKRPKTNVGFRAFCVSEQDQQVEQDDQQAECKQ